MMSAILWGLVAGLGTLAVSELILRQSEPMMHSDFWKLLTLGVAVRTTWVLLVLAVVLTRQSVEPRAFTIALMLSYLLAQVVEGIRYQRFFARR